MVYCQLPELVRLTNVETACVHVETASLRHLPRACPTKQSVTAVMKSIILLIT